MPDSPSHLSLPEQFARMGFIAFGLPCVCLGTYNLSIDYVYAPALAPGLPHCGNPAMIAVLLIFPLGPAVGLVGACLGHVLGIACCVIRKPKAGR